MQICVFVCVPELKLAEPRALSETCDMFQFFFCSESSLFSMRLNLLPPVRPPVDNADVCPAPMLWITAEERKEDSCLHSKGRVSPGSSCPRSKWTPWKMGCIKSYVFCIECVKPVRLQGGMAGSVSWHTMEGMSHSCCQFPSLV